LAGRALRAAGGLPLGLMLLGLLFAYLALASLWPAPAEWGGVQVPPLRPGEMAPPFSSWPLKLLLGLVVTNMALATLLRLRGGLAHAGAWAAHAGILVLGVGAAWYTAFAVDGMAVAWRDSPDQPFAAVDSYYVRDSLALFVGVMDAPVASQPATAPATAVAASEHFRAAQTPLPNPRGAALPGLPIEVRSPVDAVRLGVGEYIPSALLSETWRDDGPAEMPAAEVFLRDGPRPVGGVLCPAYTDSAELRMDDYTISVPGPAGEVRTAEGGCATSTSHPTAPAGDCAAVLLIPDAQGSSGKAVATYADGRREEHPVEPGKPLALSLGGRQVELVVKQFWHRAWRPVQARADSSGNAPPAVRLDVRIGEWTGETWLGQIPFLIPPDSAHSTFQPLPLPGGRRLAAQLSQRMVRLPQPFAIESPQYRTYPGSVIPANYFCRLAMLSPEGAVLSRQDLQWNQPAQIGALRLSHESWQPDPRRPMYIVLAVRSRPGIWAVWIGCILVCVAMPYAFYVKPLLLRRRRAV
jgi:hypothetical protein